MLPLGELSALAAGFIWTFTSLIFTDAGRISSPVAVNTFKVLAATAFVSAALVVTAGVPYGRGVAGNDALLLVASGILGLAIGDSLLFKSWQTLGTRRALIVFSLSPVMSAAGDVIYFGDRPGPGTAAGMTLTLGGVIWVITERRGGAPSLSRLASAASRHAIPSGPGTGAARLPVMRAAEGIALALGAAAGNAAGALLARSALQRVDVVPATQIRLAAAALWLLVFAGWGRMRSWWRDIRRFGLVTRLTIASLMGPFCGVLAMGFALSRTSAGIALTLGALTPIWLLPVGAWLQHDRPSPREATGAAVAIAGVAVLLLSASGGR
jgi:drug/metabolite transporter (DMT)-like permease